MSTAAKPKPESRADTYSSARSLRWRNLPATLTRAAQGTPPYRPPKFAFTTPQLRQSQEEYIPAKSHEDSDGSASTRPTSSPKRAFTFEAPMRPLDIARSMYLDYTTTQSIKFYNNGVKKLPR